MLRLNAFGGFAVLEPGANSPRELPRRLAAILVVLAWSGEQGISREKLVDLLWTDSDPVKARHALTQSLYALRRALGREDSIAGSSQLSLDPRAISSDLADFEAADQCGDLLAAVALHRGPFLDGFFVNGAAEFERWSAARRASYSQRVGRHLEVLAAAAEERGDRVEAVTRRRERAALDPLDASAAIALLHALADAGNVPGAVQHARVYEQLVRQELDAEPDARVALAMEEVVAAGGRRASAPSGPPAAPIAMPAVAAASVGGVGVEPVVTRSRRARGLRWWPPMLAAVVLLAISLSWRLRAVRPPAATEPPASLAVLPFRVAGATPALDFLREGMVELLTDALVSGDTLRGVDPARVLGAWRRMPGHEPGSAPVDSLLRLADGLGAHLAVTGSAVGSTRRVVLTAALYDVPSRRRLAQRSTDGPLDSLSRLVSRLSVQLVAEAAAESDVVVRHESLEMPALRAFLAGRAAYRRASWGEAMARFGTALRMDSTFASAALGVAQAADWLDDVDTRGRAIAVALAHRFELGQREVAQLAALAGTRFPDPAPSAEQLAAWERAASMAPERPEVWTELGRRLVHEGRLLGVPLAVERARATFERALGLDSAYVPARRALAALLAGDVVTGRGKDAAPALAAQSEGALAESGAAIAMRLHDEGQLARLRARMDTLSDGELRAIAVYGLHDATLIGDGWRATRLRTPRALHRADRVDVLLAEHAYALNMGRMGDAAAVLQRIAEESMSAEVQLRLQVLDALYSDGDTAVAGAAVQALAGRLVHPLASDVDHRSMQLADLCVVEQWRAWHGDVAGTARAIRVLGQPEETRYPVPGIAAGTACATLLDAIAAVQQRSPRASDALVRLDSLALTGPTAGDLRQYATLALARLREQRGEFGLALAAVRRREYARGWPRYLSTYLRAEGRLAERTGDREGARRVLSHYVALRAAAEPQLSAATAQARQALQRLE